MTDIEELFKLKNWLSVLTFDAFKYAKAGGALAVEWTEAGLVLRLPGVQIDTDGVNRKFKNHADPTGEDVATPQADSGKDGE